MRCTWRFQERFRGCHGIPAGFVGLLWEFRGFQVVSENKRGFQRVSEGFGSRSLSGSQRISGGFRGISESHMVFQRVSVGFGGLKESQEVPEGFRKYSRVVLGSYWEVLGAFEEVSEGSWGSILIKKRSALV